MPQDIDTFGLLESLRSLGIGRTWFRDVWSVWLWVWLGVLKVLRDSWAVGASVTFGWISLPWPGSHGPGNQRENTLQEIITEVNDHGTLYKQMAPSM